MTDRLVTLWSVVGHAPGSLEFSSAEAKETEKMYVVPILEGDHCRRNYEALGYRSQVLKRSMGLVALTKKAAKEAYVQDQRRKIENFKRQIDRHKSIIEAAKSL